MRHARPMAVAPPARSWEHLRRRPDQGGILTTRWRLLAASLETTPRSPEMRNHARSPLDREPRRPAGAPAVGHRPRAVDAAAVPLRLLHARRRTEPGGGRGAPQR